LLFVVVVVAVVVAAAAAAVVVAAAVVLVFVRSRLLKKTSSCLPACSHSIAFCLCAVCSCKHGF
jgi:hypothetical protein